MSVTISHPPSIQRTADLTGIGARHRQGRGSLRRFTNGMFAAIAATGIVVSLLNATIDPYWVYRGHRSTYFNPLEEQHCSRVCKGEMAWQDKIDVAILGDSRALWGIDPRHPAFEKFGSASNLGLIGASVFESSRMLELLLRKGDAAPKAVIWLVQPEFVVFDRHPQQNFDFHLSRLNPDYSEVQGRFNSLISSEATLKSLGFLLKKRTDQPTIVRGFAERLYEDSPVMLSTFTDYAEQQKKYLLRFRDHDQANEMQELLTRLFRECCRMGIRIDVVVPPSHAMYWHLLNAEGWGDRVDTGKRILCQAADQANAEFKDCDLIRIWDFSGFEGPAAEPLPTSETPKVMAYHKDAVHFSTRMGRAIVNQLFATNDDEPNLGFQLTQDNLESHLNEWKSNCVNYSQTNATILNVAIGSVREIH